ncbi:MAG: cell division protein ZapA [Bacteroidia bacterium]|jgi:hypothetical protein|nr:cell division protein ZapA [Bacteroidia bacterium]
MDTNETVLLTVKIDNRSMRLRVSKKDEAQVLAAVELLNKRIEGFKRFGSSDPLDRLSWAALDLAGDVVRHDGDASNAADTDEHLDEIEQMLHTI